MTSLKASPIYFMIELTISKQTVSRRHPIFVDLVVKTIDYDAYTVHPDFKEQAAMKKLISRVSAYAIQRQAIDKLSFTFNRDYLNESSIRKTNYGFATVVVHGNFFTVHLHREYIPTDELSLELYVKRAFRYLILCTPIFRLPTEKHETNIQNGEITNKFFPENEVHTAEEFFNRIYSQKALKCIELCFDVNKNLSTYLLHSDFFVEEGTTFYSQDYKKYDSGNKHKSFLCIYDKAKEQYDRKHQYVMCTQYRVEFRLYSESFTIVKKDKGKQLLSLCYDDLLTAVAPYILRRLKKLKINVAPLSKAIRHSHPALYMLLNRPK